MKDYHSDEQKERGVAHWANLIGGSLVVGFIVGGLIELTALTLEALATFF